MTATYEIAHGKHSYPAAFEWPHEHLNRPERNTCAYCSRPWVERNEPCSPPDLSPREQAWRRGVALDFRLRDEQHRASGGPGGEGYRDTGVRPHVTRAEIAALVTEWGFEGTFIDPEISWVTRANLGAGYPGERS